MGSFQQIFMGTSCLAAAFFFGSYLHNRPADNGQPVQPQVAAANPLDAIFFGKKSANNTSSIAQAPVVVANSHETASFPVATQQFGSAIDPSERVLGGIRGVVTAANEPAIEQPAQQPFVPAATTRKPVVPDFSELASRFRNTPLELSQTATSQPAGNAVHESERVPSFSSGQFGSFKAPELVVRQPENARPLKDFRSQVDRIEESIRGEFSAVQPQQQTQSQPETNRWRVNRTPEIDRFRSRDQAPQQDFARQRPEPRETIEDVLSRRSADYLKEESQRETWATDPPTDSWSNQQRSRVTQQAAMRNQDILDIEDPGSRFNNSVWEPTQSMAPPEPDFETAYYTPSNQRQDSVPPQAVGQNREMRSIQNAGASNWSRQSNIQSQFDNSYKIQPGDTLQSISTRFYGSADYYLEIYKANREVLDRITSSPAGVEIVIPQLNN